MSLMLRTGLPPAEVLKLSLAEVAALNRVQGRRR